MPRPVTLQEKLRTFYNIWPYHSRPFAYSSLPRWYFYDVNKDWSLGTFKKAIFFRNSRNKE